MMLVRSYWQRWVALRMGERAIAPIEIQGMVIVTYVGWMNIQLARTGLILHERAQETIESIDFRAEVAEAIQAVDEMMCWIQHIDCLTITLLVIIKQVY